MQYIKAFFYGFFIFTTLLALVSLGTSGDGIVIHPDAPHAVAFCRTADTWDLVVDAHAAPGEAQLVESLAAQHCPTIAQ